MHELRDAFGCRGFRNVARPFDVDRIEGLSALGLQDTHQIDRGVAAMKNAADLCCTANVARQRDDLGDVSQGLQEDCIARPAHRHAYRPPLCREAGYHVATDEAGSPSDRNAALEWHVTRLLCREVNADGSSQFNAGCSRHLYPGACPAAPRRPIYRLWAPLTPRGPKLLLRCFFRSESLALQGILFS